MEVTLRVRIACIRTTRNERKYSAKKRTKEDRKAEKKKCTPAERERNDVFNKALRHSRTIVEIMFGNFQRHRFMSGSGFSVETVCILFHLMFEMEKIKYDLREEEMHPTKGRVVNLEERMKTLGGECDCGWAKVYSTSKVARSVRRSEGCRWGQVRTSGGCGQDSRLEREALCTCEER